MAGDFRKHLEDEIAKLREILERDITYLRLRELEGVRGLYADPTDGETDHLSPKRTNGEKPRPKPPLRQASPERAKAVETAKLYVANRAGPVPTAEIYDHLRDLGIEVLGANPVNNLSAMLSNSNLFRPNGRSGWTLSEKTSGRTDNVSLMTESASIYLTELSAEYHQQLLDYYEENTKLPDDVAIRLKEIYKDVSGEEYKKGSGFENVFIARLRYTLENMKEPSAAD